jgi:hypothetical protein
VKGLLKYSLFAFLFAFLVTPLFAKTYSVTLAKAVTVGSTQIPAGDYKVSWEGAGPAVKVTLARSGASPVVVDAKLVTGKSFISDASVVTAAQNGSVVLQEIQVKSNTLVFEGSDVAAK